MAKSKAGTNKTYVCAKCGKDFTKEDNPRIKRDEHEVKEHGYDRKAEKAAKKAQGAAGTTGNLFAEVPTAAEIDKVAKFFGLNVADLNEKKTKEVDDQIAKLQEFKKTLAPVTPV